MVNHQMRFIFLIVLAGSLALTASAACNFSSDRSAEDEGAAEGEGEGEGQAAEGDGEGTGEGGEESGVEGEGGTLGCGTPLECRNDDDCARVRMIYSRHYITPEPLHCDLGDCRCKQCLDNDDCDREHYCSMEWFWACEDRQGCTNEDDCLMSDQPLVYMACLEGFCAICEEDADCRPGESCAEGIEIVPGVVLTEGHCIPAETEGNGGGEGADAGAKGE